MAINTNYKPGELPANHPVNFLHALGTDGTPTAVALDANGALRVSLGTGNVITGVSVANTGNSPTLTVAELLTGLVRLSGQTTAQTVTLPTAALIAATVPAGNSFEFSIQNDNSSSGAVTVTSGSGGTNVSTATRTCAIQRTKRFRIDVTSATTYNLYSLGADSAH